MNKYRMILGIETSCDETAAAVLRRDGESIKVLSNVVASSAQLQAKFGGVIPEQAAREQLKSIIPVIETALLQAAGALSYRAIELASYQKKGDKSSIASLLNCFVAEKIDAIAVTFGPGLIGSLLIGVETAKVLAAVWNKPLIPVNHLIGHFYANWIEMADSGWKIADGKTSQNYQPSAMSHPQFPCIGLLVSGGHTDLVLFKEHMRYEYIGGTRDDAAGECFDKCARLMGLPYPGGPEISRLAKDGDASKVKLPKPMMGSHDFDFSFSGLKTAVANIISEELGRTQKPDNQKPDNQKSGISDTLDFRSPSLSESFRKDLAAATESTIIDVLVKKTIGAVEKYGVSEVMVAGGVAANRNLSERLRRLSHVIVRNPQKIFCTDNGAMIAAAGFFIKETIDPIQLQANPNLSL